MTELIFVVEEAPEGGLTAHAVDPAIFTEADNLDDLRHNIRDAVVCHFESLEARPKIVRLSPSGAGRR